MSDRRRVVVIGASSGVGRAVAAELARTSADLIVSARPSGELDAVAADLRLRHGANVTAVPVDLRDPDEVLGAFVDRCWETYPGPDAVIITAGTVDDADDGLTSWRVTDEVVTTNFVGVAKVAAAFLERFDARGAGTVVLCSSIAAAVPRSRNVAYAASKAALESFGRSMHHRFAGTEVRVQVYALGYVDTAMAAGRTRLLPPAAPARVARTIVAHLDDDRRVRYLPAYWRAVVWGLRRLPWPLYRRLRF